MSLTREGEVAVLSTLLITLFAPLLVDLASAEPHSVVIPVFVVYPFACLTLIPLVDHDWIVFTIVYAQFPAYGVILWRARKAGNFRRRATWLVAVHAFAVAATFWLFFHGILRFYPSRVT